MNKYIQKHLKKVDNMSVDLEKQKTKPIIFKKNTNPTNHKPIVKINKNF